MKFNVVERTGSETSDGEPEGVALVVRGGGRDVEIRLAPSAAGGVAAVLRVVAEGLARSDPADGDARRGERRIRLVVREADLQDAASGADRLGGSVERAELEALCHDLRTPINALVGYAELLDERVYGDLTGEQAEAVRRIRSASNRLLAALRHLFERARIDLGDFYPRPTDRRPRGLDERRPPLGSRDG